MDHDHSYRLLFSHPRMVRDLLEGFVCGDWLRDVAYDSLERVESVHATDDLRERRDDIVWRIRWRDRWIYLLMEFQSAIEPFMTVRVLTYVGLLYQDLIRAKEVNVVQGLPAVLPIVIYNGQSRWWAAQELSSLLYEVPPELNQFRTMCRYVLIDEGAYDSRELIKRRNLVAMLFGIEVARSQSELDALVRIIADELCAPEDESLRRAFAVWLDQVISSRPRWGGAPTIHQLWEKPGMLAENLDRWYDEAQHQGRAEMLSYLLRKRFGPIPDPIHSRLRTADLDQLELWGEQLLDATTLTDLFPEPHNPTTPHT